MIKHERKKEKETDKGNGIPGVEPPLPHGGVGGAGGSIKGE